MSTITVRAFALVLAMCVPLRGEAQSMKVTLLGTGSPAPIVERFGPNTLVRLPPQGIAVEAEDVTEGVVYERNGVKVTVFHVDHGPAVYETVEDGVHPHAP
jgi:hypothetical protein